MEIVKPESGINVLDIMREAEELATLDLDKLLDVAIVAPGKQYPQPETVVSLSQYGNDIDILTKGSISGIIGKAKGGKTSFNASVVAAVLDGAVGNEGFQLRSPSGGKVLYFDTEQGKYYSSLTVYRIANMATNMHNLKYYDLREHGPDMRMSLIRHAINNEQDVSLVVIDGGRDIIYDINDPEQAINTITELMALSVQHNTHISIVLHQNKGDMNARGHFGTELVNKAETIISVNKSPDDKGVSVVEAEYTRGLAFEPFAIERDEEGIPHLIDNVPTSNKSPKRTKMPGDMTTPEIHSIVSEAFLNAPEDGWNYKQLRAELGEALSKATSSTSKAATETWIQLLQTRGFIKHNGEKTSKSRYTQVNDFELVPLISGQDTGQDKLIS